MRKLKQPDQRRDCVLAIRMLPAEYSNLCRAAAGDGRTMSDAARRLIEASLKHRDQEPVALAQQHAS